MMPPPYVDLDVQRRFLAPALETVMRMQAEKVEAELRDIGESLWTAPDTVQIRSYGGYSVIVNPL